MRRLGLFFLLTACASGPSGAPGVVAPGLAAGVGAAGQIASARTYEAPPGPTGPLTFDLPPVQWKTLDHGLTVGLIENHALPLVQVRVIVRGGRALDQENIGITALTAEILKAGGAGAWSGREIASELDSLGVRYGVQVGADAVEYAFAFDATQVDGAMAVIGAMFTRPRFDAIEYAKLKRRERERVLDLAKTSGRWSAKTVLNERIYGARGVHPYAAPDLLASDVEKITLDDCKEHWRGKFVAGSMTVIVAGDIALGPVSALLQERFAEVPKGSVAVAVPPAPAPQERDVITLIDRPGSTQSDIYVAALGPERHAGEWIRWAALGEILGGISGRLFLDIREKQSLAYGVGAGVREEKFGPSVLVAFAGTQSSKTTRALAALRDHLRAAGESAPSAPELSTATRFLSDGAAVQFSTLSAVVQEVGRAHVLGLPAGYLTTQRTALGTMSPSDVYGEAASHLSAPPIVVVVGDAAKVSGSLVRLGPVRVVDPAKDFAEVHRLAANPNAAWESPASTE